MLINLLYMINALTRHIIPAFVSGTPMPVLSGRDRPDCNYQSLGFHPKPENLSSPYFKVLRATYCYCLPTAVSCENMLFWTQKSGFCPSSLKTPADPRFPADKKDKSPLWPACVQMQSGLLRGPLRSRESSARGFTEASGHQHTALALSHRWADVGRTLVEPWSQLALRLLSREELSPGQGGRPPATQLGAQSLRMPLENNIFPSL